MQTNPTALYQCYTCHKRFPCKPSLDRHTISHDLEVFASWTKEEQTNPCSNMQIPQNSHIPPHKKLVHEQRGNAINGNIGPETIFIKNEVQQPESCSYQQSQPQQHHQPDLVQHPKPLQQQYTQQPSMDTHDSQNQTQSESAADNSELKKNNTTKKASKPRKQYQSQEVKVKSYFCDECSKSYFRRDHLNRHKLVHTGDRPFVCSVCLKSFIRKDKLQRHEKIHLKDRIYSCDFCGKGFGRKDALNKHHLAHQMGNIKSQNKDNSAKTVKE